VGAAVCTADGWVVLIRRSQGVGEGQGLLDVPGGHPEPSRLGLDSLSPPPALLEGLSGEALVAELFESAAQEVVDEVNVPRAALSAPRLMGVVRQANSAGCPSAAFLLQCGCGRAQVEAHYAQGPAEAFESTALAMLPLQAVKARQLPPDLTPSARGCLELLAAIG
jgi:hypothetical protein